MDSQHLKELYDKALDDSLKQFKLYLNSAESKSWKPVAGSTYTPSTSVAATPSSKPSSPTPPNAATFDPSSHSLSTQSAAGKGAALGNGIGPLDPNTVRVHRRAGKGVDVYRAQADIAIQEGSGGGTDVFRAVLQTPEVRAVWDKLVEHANVVELLDPQTRIVKTDFRLGWPASPRDTITIQKTFCDPSTLIDISTSLPRSKDEPAFLRPAPPYVRSHVQLYAWCIQMQPGSQPGVAQTSSNDPETSGSRPSTSAGTSSSVSQPSIAPTENRARITLFWQWSLKGTPLLTSSPHTTFSHLSKFLASFVSYARSYGDRIPLLASYGSDLLLSESRYDESEETLRVAYDIIALDEHDVSKEREQKGGITQLREWKEGKRLERAIEIELPPGHGWNVLVGVQGLGPGDGRGKGKGKGVDTSWKCDTERSDDPSTWSTTLRISHARLKSPDDIVRVRLSIQRLAGGKILRVNGETVKVATIESRTPSALMKRGATGVLDDVSSISGLSLDTTETSNSASSSEKPATATPTGHNTPSPNSTAAVVASVRRSYTYFASLLQEPSAKWRHVSDYRGVTVAQLDSIDPTLTIYKAEAVFVGVGVWDVFSSIESQGSRTVWDKNQEDAVLLDEINELTGLWWIKTKGAWPVAPRDSVQVRTCYKSPSTVHIFSFSTDDHSMFPSIPPPPPGVIRSQTDLQGWSIEALSPTTTQITLIDQTDPKGWSDKSWTPRQLVNLVSGVGDFAIKSGGPPVVTRLTNAKANLNRYDHDRGSLRVEYKASTSSPPPALSGLDQPLGIEVDPDTSSESPDTIECEVRCDVDVWASSLDVVIDPPPSKVSCLSRHRLSSGGGCWVTIEHDLQKAQNERILVIIRRGSANREKGSVLINGSRATVDTEQMADDQVKLLSQRKRVKVSPIPLDQYPSLASKMWKDSNPPSKAGSAVFSPTLPPQDDPMKNAAPPSPTAATFASGDAASPSKPPKSPMPPMAYALEGLASLQVFHAEQSPDPTVSAAGWIPVTGSPLIISKKLIPSISDTLPVFRGDKIVQGLNAEQLISVLSNFGARYKWDDRLESSVTLQSYGNGSSLAAFNTKGSFPFRGRHFNVAMANAQFKVPSASTGSSTSTVYLCSSASYPVPADDTFAPEKLNPNNLPRGNVLFEGWIVETLDPYTSNDYTIPSTRVSFFASVDYSGSMILSYSSGLNAALPRIVDSLEKFVKSQGSLPRLHAPLSALEVEGPLTGSIEEAAWVVRPSHLPTTAVHCNFSSFDSSFRALLRVRKDWFKTSTPSPKATLKTLPGTSTVDRGGSIKASNRKSRGSFSLASHPTLREGSPTPDLRHKNSASSLASVTKAAGPNGTTKPSKNDHEADIRVADIRVDGARFPGGYDISYASHFPPSDEEDLDLASPRNYGTREVPLKVVVHELPLDTSMSAALDASSRRRDHFVRITIETASIINPLRDPLTTDEPKPQPTWFRRLVEEGAIIHLKIGPTSKNPPPSSNIFTQIPVSVNCGKIHLANEKETKALLEAIEDDDSSLYQARISRLDRKPTVEGEESQPQLPNPLLKPTAVARDLVAEKKPLETELDDSKTLEPATVESVTPSSPSEPGPSTSGPQLPTSEAANSKEPTEVEGGPPPTPLLGILGSNPLAKLSATMAGTNAPATSHTHSYPFSFVLVVAIISFLLGSLLRSLLAPSDYVMVPFRPDANFEDALLNAIDPSRRWKEARRLLEVGWLFNRWTIIVAAVKNQ